MDKNYLSLKIRKLTRKDRKVLTSLIGKLASKIQNSQILELIQSGQSSSKVNEDPKKAEESSNAFYAQFAIQIFNSLLEVLEEDVAIWFSDLLGVTVEKYDSLPFGIDAFVVQQISESGELADFFASASAAYKAIQRYKNHTKNGKTK